MSYKGKFRPSNTKKYRGDPTNIIYRSLWDLNENILEWGSEEFWIPYRSPVDSRVHRYFPDFYIKVRESNGSIKKYVIEIKPKRQCVEPKVQEKKTKSYIREVTEYAKNQAKWKAAQDFCEDRNWLFKVFTEVELGI